MKEENYFARVLTFSLEFLAIILLMFFGPVFVIPFVIVLLFLHRLSDLMTASKDQKLIQIENQIWEKKWLVDQAKIKRQIFEATSSPMSFHALCAHLQQNQPQDTATSANSIEICLMEMVKDGILIYSQGGYVHQV